MANGFVQLVAFIMMVAASIMTICICVFPEWKVNDTQGEVIETIRRSQGLWISVSSRWQLTSYSSLFDSRICDSKWNLVYDHVIRPLAMWPVRSVFPGTSSTPSMCPSMCLYGPRATGNFTFEIKIVKIFQISITINFRLLLYLCRLPD